MYHPMYGPVALFLAFLTLAMLIGIVLLWENKKKILKTQRADNMYLVAETMNVGKLPMCKMEISKTTGLTPFAVDEAIEGLRKKRFVVEILGTQTDGKCNMPGNCVCHQTPVLRYALVSGK